MAEHIAHRLDVTAEVLGPWSLETRAILGGLRTGRPTDAGSGQLSQIRTVFPVEGAWSRAEVRVTQQDSAAQITVTGAGDLDRAAAQVRRFRASPANI